MIERLYNEERQCEAPAYIEATAQITQVRQQLIDRLDTDGQALLDQLELLYLRQSGAELRNSFAEGFSTAVKLLLETLEC